MNPPRPICHNSTNLDTVGGACRTTDRKSPHWRSTASREGRRVAEGVPAALVALAALVAQLVGRLVVGPEERLEVGMEGMEG